jgi:hypothetical protein
VAALVEQIEAGEAELAVIENQVEQQQDVIVSIHETQVYLH